ncbi:MAG: XdhC family protein [Terracidiphilus sp.]|jgi:xanthine/CO dehydrogenase XdhC/CoxF family maturation factor
MSDLERILPLWRELETARADYVLATVVAVEGSSYRKPGAHMVLAGDGRRAGTVSGGCLEAEVARRAQWLTAQGPVVERYSTKEDDGDRPYGSGCGGVVSLLLERSPTAAPLLAALEQAFEERIPLGVATILDGPAIGHRAFAGLGKKPLEVAEAANGLEPTADRVLQELAEWALESCAPVVRRVAVNGLPANTWADYRPARPGLWIFGGGDDARPMVRLARELDWFVAVADGRSDLANRERFPTASQVSVLPMGDLSGGNQPGAGCSIGGPAATVPSLIGLKPTDAAVVMAHSFEQDSRVLAALLSLAAPPAYVGVLGPQRRTRELLAEAARLLGMDSPVGRAERWLRLMHAPMGLDLGADTPATIALSVLAEIQQVLTAATGLPLRRVRVSTQAIQE